MLTPLYTDVDGRSRARFASGDCLTGMSVRQPGRDACQVTRLTCGRLDRLDAAAGEGDGVTFKIGVVDLPSSGEPSEGLRVRFGIGPPGTVFIGTAG